MSLKNVVASTALIASLAPVAAAAPQKRALLIGINDYTASRLPPQSAPAPERDWSNLNGAVNDALSMRQMLVALRGFAPQNITTLTDQSATREAILRVVERQLLAPASRGDIVFFYYAGHGSQVRNTRSSELDQLDESIVPADSRRGAPDIRDKELRRLFNRILDRGAHLTVMIDACHSGSGARGLRAGGTVRGVRPDLRDVADGAGAGPRPEERGALVLSASQDFEDAREKKDDSGNIHGAFTWAWMRAMREATPGESAFDMFLRAQARLRMEMPFQEPVIAANGFVRRTPFLGSRTERERERQAIGVARVLKMSTVLLEGGWANGLSTGTELRAAHDPQTRLIVTSLVGLGEAEAHVEQGHVESGTLVEPVSCVFAPARPLGVWMPRVASTELPISGLARLLAMMAAKRRIRWINDPTVTTPDYVLRHTEAHWELIEPDGSIQSFSADDDGAESAIGGVAAGSALFVELPASATLAHQLTTPAIELTARPDEADYILTGRFASRRLTYAFVRPGVTRVDRRKCGLPVRTMWTSDADTLRDALTRLRKIASWQFLDSPAIFRSPYHLALRRERDDALVRGTTVAGHERYRAVLRGTNLPPLVDARFFYLFVIDSHGQSILLFPSATSGSVENRFPIDPGSAPPEEIPLTTFDVSPPYGVDTYILLTTDQPLPSPAILEWNGVRLNATPSKWSIEKTLWESKPQER
jgi:uncharacterized caspase-like protein